MIKVDEKSNAQSWELEVTCKNKEYLDAVVKAILKYEFIEFEVNLVDVSGGNRYTVLLWCSWFSNLHNISKDLNRIERKFENYL